MKKIAAILTALVMVLMMVGAAAAETISPLPARTDINNLEDRFVTTNIQYKGNGIATLTLLEYEHFDGEAVRAIQPGDVIVTEGQEITVATAEWDGPDLVINKDTETEVRFCEAADGHFELVEPMSDWVHMAELGSFDQEILPYIVFMDYVEPQSGEPLELPTVTDGNGLLALLESADGASFEVRNVRILYDNNNQPTLIWRFYSSAQ